MLGAIKNIKGTRKDQYKRIFIGKGEENHLCEYLRVS